MLEVVKLPFFQNLSHIHGLLLIYYSIFHFTFLYMVDTIFKSLKNFLKYIAYKMPL